jgi:hypothetical protein
MEKSIEPIVFPLLSVPDDILLQIVGYLAGTNDSDIGYLAKVCTGFGIFFKNNFEAIRRIVAKQHMLIEQKHQSIILLNSKVKKEWCDSMDQRKLDTSIPPYIPTEVDRLTLAFKETCTTGSTKFFEKELQDIPICTHPYYLQGILQLISAVDDDPNIPIIKTIDKLIVKWIEHNSKWFNSYILFDPVYIKWFYNNVKRLSYLHTAKAIESIGQIQHPFLVKEIQNILSARQDNYFTDDEIERRYVILMRHFTDLVSEIEEQI